MTELKDWNLKTLIRMQGKMRNVSITAMELEEKRTRGQEVLRGLGPLKLSEAMGLADYLEVSIEQVQYSSKITMAEETERRRKRNEVRT